MRIPGKSSLKFLFPRAYRLLQDRTTHLSQAGQDVWVLGEVFNEMKGGYFVDVGAHDGVELSNTYMLERRYGWRGLCIEANPATFDRLRRNRRSRCVNACLDAQEGFAEFACRDVLGGIVSADTDNRGNGSAGTVRLPTRMLGQVLDEAGAPREIDYLSIDVEGAEERVMRGIDLERYRFNCMTVERPSASLRRLFEDRSYLLIKEIPGLDCFYVHAQFLERYKANLFAYYHKQFVSLRWR